MFPYLLVCQCSLSTCMSVFLAPIVHHYPIAVVHRCSLPNCVSVCLAPLCVNVPLPLYVRYPFSLVCRCSFLSCVSMFPCSLVCPCFDPCCNIVCSKDPRTNNQSTGARANPWTFTHQCRLLSHALISAIKYYVSNGRRNIIVEILVDANIAHWC